MIRRPRSLSRARLRGQGTLYVGPEFAGPEPKYLAKLDAFNRENAHRFARGEVARVGVYHDDDCSIFEGGACDCDPEVGWLP